MADGRAAFCLETLSVLCGTCPECATVSRVWAWRRSRHDGGVCACRDLERSAAPDPMDLRDAMYT